MDKKKILFIVYTYSHGGGAEKILSNVVNSMDYGKYDIYIQEYLHFGLKTEQTNENVKILKPIIDVTNRSLLNRLKNFIVDKLIYICPQIIRKLFLNKRFDGEIAFNYMIPSLLLDKNNNNIFGWVHGAIDNLKEDDKLRNIQHETYKYVKNIVAISNRTYNSLIEVFPDYEKKTIIINNGYDFDEILEKSKFENNDVISTDLVFCGRLDENKNPLKLIEITKLVKEEIANVKVGFIGTGALLNEVENKIEEYGLKDNVILYGYQNNPYPFIKASKLLCMTSYSEGFPTVLIEGLTLGKPFISTPVAGIDEISNDYKYGLSSNDNEDYKNKIIKLLTNEEVYNTMSSDGKEYVLKYSLKNQISKIEELLSEV